MELNTKLNQMLAEYLQEEANVLPSRLDYEEFLDNIKLLDQYIINLEAKIKKLENLDNFTG